MPGGRRSELIGHIVGGRYELRGVLGSGGMGTVWRAQDRLLDREVAAKALDIGWGRESGHGMTRERSLREARATARINHPNVVRVYDYVEEGDLLWIVMELLDARSLDTVLEQDGPLSPLKAAAVAVQMVRALRTVHERGVLHRDVKPGNVLVEADGHAVLTDFGIAALDGGAQLTGTGALVGSPEFMAPERIATDDPGPASDLWSLGVTLCAMVTGASPFRRSTPIAILHAIVIEAPTVPAEALGPLEPLVRDLLAREPADRPDAAEVERRLSELLAREETRLVPQHELPAPRRGADDGTAPVLWEADLVPVTETSPEEPTPPPQHEGPGSRHGYEGHDETLPRVPTPPRGHRAAPTPPPPAEEAARTPVDFMSAENPTTVLPRPGSARPRAAGHGAGPAAARPERSGGRRRRRLVLVLAALLAAAGLVVVALLQPWEGEGKPKKQDKQAGGGGTSTPSAAATTGASQAPAAPVYPDGAAAGPEAVRVVQEDRFSWPVPKNWASAPDPGQPRVSRYEAPGKTSQITGRLEQARPADLLKAWQDSESNQAMALLTDYKQVSLEKRTIAGNEGVVWEYTFTDGGVPRHAVLAAFVHNGLFIEVDLFSTPKDIDRDRALHAKALLDFKPKTGAQPTGAPA